jgi:hypothetical protein
MMRIPSQLGVWFLSALFSMTCLAVSVVGQSGPFLITNDDYPFSTNGITFYTIGTGGTLTQQAHVQTGGMGIGGGYFGMSRLAILNTTGNQCVYASQTATGQIAGVAVATETLGGTVSGSGTDTGLSNGIGLAANTQYLYASFSDSSNIGTFAIESGCSLNFIGDINTIGLNGGFVNAMALHGSLMVVSYTDGSIESFNISSGVPVSNGDKQNSTGSRGGASYPNGIDITQDGHFAIFGDTSTSMMVEVSDISSGKLAPTVVYKFHGGINSSNVMLSPDESMLYIANTQGDSVTAAFFNSTTGVPTAGCTSGKLKGYVSGFSYLASLALQQTTGNGGGVFVAEFGATPTIGAVNLTVSSGTCTLTEATGSPVSDVFSTGLLSIGVYPPRAF